MPPSPLTPTGRSRPRCKFCKAYMLGHNKAACDSSKSRASSVHSPNTTSTPPSSSTWRSSSPYTKDSQESYVGIFISIRYHHNLMRDWQIYGPLTMYSGTDSILFLRRLHNLPASLKTHVFVFEETDSSSSFQREAQKLAFHSALQVYCSPHTSKATSVVVVVGESKEHVSSALQECLCLNSHIAWPPAAWSRAFCTFKKICTWTINDFNIWVLEMCCTCQ